MANAKTYGGGKTWLTWDLNAEGHTLVVDVCNDAVPGTARLTPDVVETMFSGFATSTRSTHSTRLGLPSARRIMDAIGGSIELSQNKDSDVVVCHLEVPILPIENDSSIISQGGLASAEPEVTIPRQQIPAAGPLPTAEASSEPTSGQEEEPIIIHVCVVEDDPFQNEFYTLILPRLLQDAQVSCFGIKEQETVTAASCILAITPPPEIVILDYLLDYSTQGKMPTARPSEQARFEHTLNTGCRTGGGTFYGTDLADDLRKGGYTGLLVLRSATLFDEDRKQKLSHFDLVVEKGNFEELEKLSQQLLMMVGERRYHAAASSQPQQEEQYLGT